MHMMLGKNIKTAAKELLVLPAWLFEKPRFRFDKKKGLTLIYTGSKA